MLEGAVAARIESVEPLSHGVKVVVETGRYGRKTVYCGAPNCRAGISTVWVPMARKVISGVESDGMLAAGIELGTVAWLEQRGSSLQPGPDRLLRRLSPARARLTSG